MVPHITRKLLMVMTMVLLSIGLANATQSFSLDKNSFGFTMSTSSSETKTVTVDNTGNEKINITTLETNLSDGSNTISVSASPKNIDGLNAGNTKDIDLTVSSGSTPGNYSGDVVVKNSDNSSMNKSVSMNVEVTEASLNIAGEGSTIIMSGELEDTIRTTLNFENDGDTDLSNLQFDSTNLDGEISSDNIDDNDVLFSREGFDLDKGNTRSVELEVEIPDNIEIDTYTGEISVKTDEGVEFTWDLEVRVTGGDFEISIEDYTEDVRNDLIKMTGEPGKQEDEYFFSVQNSGDINVRDLQFEMEGNLEEEYSTNTIPASAVSFSPNRLDVDNDEEESVEVRVDIPDDQAIGTYTNDIRVMSSSGKEYDTVGLQVEVRGDIYIEDVKYDNNVSPGDRLEVTATIKNSGNKVYRNMVFSGVLYDVDYGDTDLSESTSSFILGVGEEKKKSIRFKIPEEADHGSHTLELKVNYGTEELVEVEDVEVTRPETKIDIESNRVSPALVSCEKNVYSSMKVRNLGRYDEDVRFKSSIRGTDISEESPLIDLYVDNTAQKSLRLDVSSLEPGEYEVDQRVIYSGNLFKKKTSTIVVEACNGGENGVDYKPINDTVDKNATGTGSSGTYDIMGENIPKTTVYLATGLVVIIILIIITMLML